MRVMAMCLSAGLLVAGLAADRGLAQEPPGLGAPAGLPGASERRLAAPDEFVVRRGAGVAPGLSAAQLAERGAVRRGRGPGIDLLSLSEVSALPALEGRLGGAVVEPNFLYYSDAMPDDPGASEQWAIAAVRAADAWAVASDASDVVVAVIDDGVMLAHDDLAANLWVNEGEIPGNGRDDDNNGFIDDIHGWDFGDGDNNPAPDLCAETGTPNDHGSHVAGTVGAVGGNATGVIGMAPRVRIMALKVMAASSCAGMTLFSIAQAVDYARLNGAKIINMSLGSYAQSEILRTAVQDASDAGLLVVMSAGNDGMDNDSDVPLRAEYLLRGRSLERRGERVPSESLVIRRAGPDYPAAHDIAGLISVAATREVAPGAGAEIVRAWWPWMEGVEPYTLYQGGVFSTEPGRRGMPDFSRARGVPLVPGRLSMGSNFGIRRVHIAAPGKAILSTVPVVAQSGEIAPGYASLGGTSMAAPHVAGAAALVWSVFPQLSAEAIKARLMATAAPAPDLADKVASGGQLDLYAALCAPGAPQRLAGCAGGASTGAGADAGAVIATTPAVTPGAAQPSQPRRTEAEDPTRGLIQTAPPAGTVNINDLFD